MGDDLEARLQKHAQAFQGLMSLIPAKEYYGKDASITSEQWRKTKKQSVEERQNAKRAKLDPASHKTAKDVMDENDRKRKRELEGTVDSSDIDLDIEKEKPFEGMKKGAAATKKQKTKDGQAVADSTVALNEDTGSSRAKTRADKRKLKAEKKKEKAVIKKSKTEEKKAQQEEATAAFGADQDDQVEGLGDDSEMMDALDGGDMDAMDIGGLVEEPRSTATPSADSAGSSASIVSAASSTSSIVPPTSADALTTVEKPAKKKFDLTPEQHEAFKARLAAKLEQLRTARKADGPDGRPAKNRAELIETRRKKEQERKNAKKANRQLAKEDEVRMKAEAELARLRGSGSPYSISGMFPPGRASPEQEQNLAFGRVAWRDGQQLDSTVSGFLDSRKRKGPSDPRTALEAMEKKRNHISGLDEEKRTDIEEKELWLTAKKRAQGEKVHDDVSLLKKSLKRKEKEKAKSKQEWKDRITSISHGKEMKQKKRETNLKKRRDESKKGGGKVKKSKKPPKKVKRAGFEGTFKGR